MWHCSFPRVAACWEESGLGKEERKQSGFPTHSWLLLCLELIRMKPLSSWQRGGSSRAPSHPKTPPRMWQCPWSWLAAWLLWVAQGLCCAQTQRVFQLFQRPPGSGMVLWAEEQFAPPVCIPLGCKKGCRVYRGGGVLGWGGLGRHCWGDPRCRAGLVPGLSSCPAAGRFPNAAMVRGWLRASCVS